MVAPRPGLCAHEINSLRLGQARDAKLRGGRTGWLVGRGPETHKVHKALGCICE